MDIGGFRFFGTRWNIVDNGCTLMIGDAMKKTGVISRAAKHSAEIRRLRDARMYASFEQMLISGRQPPFSRAEKQVIRGARRYADTMPRGTQLLYDPYIHVMYAAMRKNFVQVMRTTIEVDAAGLVTVFTDGVKCRPEMTMLEFISGYFYAPNFVAEALAQYDGDEKLVKELSDLSAEMRALDSYSSANCGAIDAWLARYAMRKVMNATTQKA